jgi:NAD-dependent dihydropyrimidine dehydrogenase PreA subunit
MNLEQASIERYTIRIDEARCTGCGACVEACPSGALYLVDGKAAVDNALCRGCEACLNTCPVGALALVPEQESSERQLAPQQEPEVIRVRTEPAPAPLRTRVLPVMGAALVWAGREIVPRVVDVLLEVVDRRTTRTQVVTGGRNDGTPSRGGGGRGHQHRHRRRGGR